MVIESEGACKLVMAHTRLLVHQHLPHQHHLQDEAVRCAFLLQLATWYYLAVVIIFQCTQIGFIQDNKPT